MTSERLCAGQPSARAPRTALQNAGGCADPHRAPFGRGCAMAQLAPSSEHATALLTMGSHGTVLIIVDSCIPPRFVPSSLRPQIFQYPTRLSYLLFMRQIAQRFRERMRIPFAHGAQLQETPGVCRRRRIESEAIGLDSKRDRRIEGVDRGECSAGEERAAETAQAVAPQGAEPGKIALERRRRFVQPDAQAAAHRTAAPQCTEARMH